jgi:hypothetical protein
MTDDKRSEATVHSTASGFVGAPEGMTLSEFAAHPVRQAIHEAAFHGEGAIPSQAELDRLKLPGVATREVAKAAREAATEHGTGRQAQAWSMGDEAAAKIIDGLAGEQRDPTYLDPPPGPESTDPRELARGVQI